MNQKECLSFVESILFANGDPVSVSRLTSALDVSDDDAIAALHSLRERYAADESGLSLVFLNDQWQITTKPSNAAHIEAFAKKSLQETLSNAALEVLAVIAYRGPITRTEIEAIRGVNCSVTVRNLLLRELIEREENENDAREYLYTVSFRFLKELGLHTASELPEYESLTQDARLSHVLNDSADTKILS